jgi:hypothetical protein
MMERISGALEGWWDQLPAQSSAAALLRQEASVEDTLFGKDRFTGIMTALACT